MDESAVWAIIFANLVGMQMHPGQGKNGPMPSYQELALLADKALAFWKIRYDLPED